MSQTRTRTVQNASNQSIVDMLETQLLETESTNYKHTLRRALRAIRVYKEPILTKAVALKVPFVGQHIATQIQVHLAERRSHSPPQPMASESGAILLPDQPEPSPTRPARRPRAPRAPARRREYVPQFRSSAYAILIALYHAESSGIAAMRKDDLARSAQQYCDTPVLTTGSSDPSTWYDGWSAVNKTLVSKGLVARRGRPIKFSLSAAGRELAESLIDMNNDVLAMGTSVYDAGQGVDIGVGNLPVVTAPRGARVSRVAGAGGSQDDVGSEDDLGSQDIVAASEKRVPAASQKRVAASSQHAAASSQHAAASSQVRPQVLSQEDADLEMARALARQFVEEDAAGAEGRPAPKQEPKKATATPTREPHADPETAAALERQYSSGREFGAVAPGVPPSTLRCSKPASRAKRRKMTPAQCDRATRVIQRLEAGGYDRADCIKVVEILHAEKALPRTVDGLYQAAVSALWEAEKQERQLGTSSEPIGLNISALDSFDDDAIGKQMEEEEVILGRERSQHQLPVPSGPVLSDSIFRASSADRIELTTETRPTKDKEPTAPVVVIDLDEDSRVGIGSSKASREQEKSPYTSNPPKRPRVADVIAIDSDDEGMGINDDSILEVPVQPATYSASKNLKSSPRERESRCENDESVLARDNGNAGNPNYQEGSTSGEVSVAENGFETSCLTANQSSRPVPGQECRVVLLLDSMERFRNSNTLAGHVKSPGDLLLEEGVDCEVRTLPTGDALFVARFPDGSEIVLDYIIERKTIEDYAASMKDGRVARQTYLMRHAKIKRRVFLLEGDLKEKDDLYNQTELHKKLAEMTMCSGLYVKQTSDIQDTVYFYASLFRRLQRKFLKQSKPMTLRERSLFPDWFDRMNTMKKNLTLEQLFMIQLCQIPGLGTTKAQAIIEMGYKTPFLLHMAYKRLTNQEDKDEMLNKGEHAIGSTSSKAVSHLFTQREYPTIVKPTM